MIKIIRLTNNQDIICDCEADDTMIKVTKPLCIYIEHTNQGTEMIMKEWIHRTLVSKHDTQLNPVNIICMFEPAEDVKEFYVNSLKRYEGNKGNLEERTPEEMDYLMEILKDMEPSNQAIH